MDKKLSEKTTFAEAEAMVDKTIRMCKKNLADSPSSMNSWLYKAMGAVEAIGEIANFDSTPLLEKLEKAIRHDTR